MASPELNRGLALYRQQQFGAAEQEFRRVLASRPANVDARLYLARTLIELNRISEALAEIERALDKTPTPETRFQAGRLLRELAERRFEQLEAAAPGSPAVREFSGMRFERIGDLAQALDHYRAAAALAPKRPGVHYLIGNILWRMRELDSAASELQKELTVSPHHGMANLRLGQVLISQDRAEQALPYLQRAIEAMPDSLEARREAGKAYKSAGRLTDARSEWERVAKARPDDDQIHYLLGNLYRDLGEGALARRELETHRQVLQRRRETAGKP